MSSTDLNDLVPLLSLVSHDSVELLKLWNERVVNLASGCDVDGCGKGIIGALSHVDVIVWMDRFRFRKAIATHQLNGTIGDDFIDVHVARRSRARLKNIDRKLTVHFSIDDILASRIHGFHLIDAEPVFACER